MRKKDPADSQPGGPTECTKRGSVTSDLNCFFSHLYLARRLNNTLQTQITTIIRIFATLTLKILKDWDMLWLPLFQKTTWTLNTHLSVLFHLCSTSPSKLRPSVQRALFWQGLGSCGLRKNLHSYADTWSLAYKRGNWQLSEALHWHSWGWTLLLDHITSRGTSPKAAIFILSPKQFH